ncbi:MAG: hypothetical protein ACE5IQ_04990 [Candidatus Methylomirabilales bacterium]
MGDSRLTRRDVLIGAVGGSAAFMLSPAKGVMAAKPSPDAPFRMGDPSIGDPGYEQRIAGLFEQAMVRKPVTLKRRWA